MDSWLDELIGTIQRCEFGWREYAGRWHFAGPAIGVEYPLESLGVQADGWGKFIADFKYAVSPGPPRFTETILYQRPILDGLGPFLGLDYARDPNYNEAVNTDPIDIMDEINLMPQTQECCEAYKPSLIDTLTQKQQVLTRQLDEVNAALEALKRNPELQQTLDLLRKVARF